MINRYSRKREIAKITDRVIYLLELDVKAGTPIYINDNNIERIKRKHPEDFTKYGSDLIEIINNPTYVSLHPVHGSIEYIRVYRKEQDYVLVGVRVSTTENYYVRTLFVMSNEKVYRYWLKGVLRTY